MTYSAIAVTPLASVFVRVNDCIGVRFTQLELDAMWALARKRQEAKSGGATDRRSDTRLSNIQMHYIGIKGEYAVAKYLGIGFDMRSLTDGDDYGDLLWRGRHIEVKNLQDWLLFTPGTFLAEVAVLVNPLRERPDRRVTDKPPHAYKDVVLRGWITKERFIEHSYVHDFGYGPRLCVRPDRLSPMEDIFPRNAAQVNL